MKRFLSHPFTRARIILTFWYSVLLLFILLSFSIVLYATQNHDFTRIVVQRNFRGMPPPRVVSQSELYYLQEQVEALRRSFILHLIAIDAIILFIGGFLSYMLAGITLEPIRVSLDRQKQFTQDASHELRTPLAALKTTAEVALRGKSSTKVHYKKVISQMYEETTRLEALVKELLMLSKIDAEEVALKIKPIDISKIIQDVVDEMLPLSLGKKQEVVTNTEPLIVKADPDRIKQLLLILIDNAIKYTPDRGIITVSTDVRPTPRVTISDTGIGIPKEELHRVFDRFFQSNKARSDRGAGLGLSIAKQIAAQHKAKLLVQSKEKEGTTVSVVFPK